MSAIHTTSRKFSFAAGTILGLPLSLITAALITSGAAHALCYEPDPPSRSYKPSKPIVPFCVNEWNNTHTCDEWQISAYNSDVMTYNSEIDDYVRRLRLYLSEAEEYVRCEIRSLE